MLRLVLRDEEGRRSEDGTIALSELSVGTVHQQGRLTYRRKASSSASRYSATRQIESHYIA